MIFIPRDFTLLLVLIYEQTSLEDSQRCFWCLLTSHRGRVDVEGRFLKPRRNGNVVANETGHVASHKYVVAEETAGTLHFRIVTLIHH